jgi:4-amino-4-deoxy-L-arabinose transferase-like glycosyltransferase
MFFDGTVYAAIAKNMALGKGTFWSPHYTETLYTVFYEHPPLALWLESLFFRLFGTSVLVERFYSVLCIVVVGFFVVKIWKEITNEIVTAWLPLLFFISFPIITWTATNNMLENTMSVFICCSVFFYLKGIRKKKYCFTIISGLSLFLGMLSKGVAAFFPWTIPFLVFLFSKRIPFKQVVIDAFLLVICTLLPLFLLYISFEDAKQFFDNYLSKQLFSSVAGMREVVDSRFFIVKRLWDNIIPALFLIIGLFVAVVAKKRTNLLKEQLHNSLLFLSLSLCGVLPIMISLKQSGFYIVPAYPFLAIAFALPFQPFVKSLIETINGSSKVFFVFKTITCLVFIAVIVFSVSQKGKIARSKEMLQLVFACGKYIPSNTTISIDKETYSRWTLHSYFARYATISLDQNNIHRYYLHDKNLPLSSLDENSTVLTKIGNFVLMERNGVE